MHHLYFIMIIIKHNYHYLHASLFLNFGEIIHNFLRLSDLAPSGQKQRCRTHEGATTETALAAVSYTMGPCVLAFHLGEALKYL